MDAQWVTWALQALIVYVLYKTDKRLDENTSAINLLTLKLAQEFVGIKEWESLRIRLHNIEDWISGQKAVADLKRLKGD